MNFVVGFLFTHDHEKVVLIEKKRPTWQSGKLNGVGGKIEGEEAAVDAMAREFEQETGVAFGGWSIFMRLKVNDDTVFFCVGVSDLVSHVGSPTDEKVFVVETKSVAIDRLPAGWPVPFDGRGIRALPEPVYNLPWLVPMALDALRGKRFYTVHEGKELPFSTRAG